MYARMTTFRISRNEMENAVSIYKESIIPEAKMQNGFEGAFFFVNDNAGKFVSVTMWDSVDDAVRNQKNGYYQNQIDKFSGIMIDRPEIEGFESAEVVCDKFLK